MKKFIFLSLLMLLLTGCDVYPIFVGESDNWKGQFLTTSKSGNYCENGEYTLHFIEGTKDNEVFNIEVTIDDLKLTEDKLLGNTLFFKGCTRISEKQGIEVTIKWNDVNEETFLLVKKG